MMENKRKLTRREALKRMGTLVAGGMAAASGIFPLTSCESPKPRRIIFYFTGTGNSRYCAELLADKLRDRCLDAFPFIRGGIAAELSSEKPWVFVCPTYAWRMPRVFVDFIRAGQFSGCREAYFVMTCGGETGDAVSHAAELCVEKGLLFQGLQPVVMPDNYLVLFSAPKPEEISKKLAAARPALEAAAKRILAGEAFPPLKTGTLARMKSSLVNTGMYRYFLKTKNFYATDACTGCGKCAAACPLGSIRLRDGKPQWSSRCTHCMACLCGCPAEAIQYGRGTRKKARYLCPPYRPYKT